MAGDVVTYQVPAVFQMFWDDAWVPEFLNY